ncbi:hypothetical protein [Ideonella sp.]|nr:hypothetical protein [Ideonella sp.]HJV68512.1 hypothetical protein [Ideonella sp.]
MQTPAFFGATAQIVAADPLAGLLRAVDGGVIEYRHVGGRPR